jgi:hypothetical protein
MAVKSTGTTEAGHAYQQSIAVGLLDDSADACHVLSSISEHNQVQAALVLRQYQWQMQGTTTVSLPVA